MIYELTDVADDLSSFSIISDVNGPKNPNTVKKDLYKFKVGNSGKVSDISSDLEDVSDCSLDNLSACRNEEECEAINACDGCDFSLNANTYWYGNSCYVTDCGCG